MKSPSLMHQSHQYLYSKPSYSSYGIGLVGGGKLEPSIRSINVIDSPKQKVLRTKYFHIPLHLLRMSKNKFIESTNASVLQTKQYKIIGNFDNNNKLLRNNQSTTSNNVQVFLIPFSKINKQDSATKSNLNRPANNSWESINVKKYKDINSKLVERTITNSNNQISKPISDHKLSTIYSNLPKPINQNKPSVILQSIKSSINSLISKPTIKPVKQNIIGFKEKNSTIIENISDDYYSDSEEKTFLSSIKKQDKKDQNETLKDGGIIIQRLKVRKGGIAIAGPGGIATAGSGGTAIVGPGGFALTHPKSLTIAGPGAKILAYPSETDLKEVLLNSNGDELLHNGKIVATGPAIYYNNGS